MSSREITYPVGWADTSDSIANRVALSRAGYVLLNVGPDEGIKADWRYVRKVDASNIGAAKPVVRTLVDRIQTERGIIPARDRVRRRKSRPRVVRKGGATGGYIDPSTYAPGKRNILPGQRVEPWIANAKV